MKKDLFDWNEWRQQEEVKKKTKPIAKRTLHWTARELRCAQQIGEVRREYENRLRQIAEILKPYEPVLREYMGQRSALWIRHDEVFRIMALAKGTK